MPRPVDILSTDSIFRPQATASEDGWMPDMSSQRLYWIGFEGCFAKQWPCTRAARESRKSQCPHWYTGLRVPTDDAATADKSSPIERTSEMLAIDRISCLVLISDGCGRGADSSLLMSLFEGLNRSGMPPILRMFWRKYVSNSSNARLILIGIPGCVESMCRATCRRPHM